MRLTAGEAAPGLKTDIPIETDGATLAMSVPRRDLGDPETFAVSIAAAREWNDAGDEPAEAEPDIVPDTGTWLVDFDVAPSTGL